MIWYNSLLSPKSSSYKPHINYRELYESAVAVFQEHSVRELPSGFSPMILTVGQVVPFGCSTLGTNMPGWFLPLSHTHRYTKIWASLSQHTAVTPSAFLVKTYVTGRWPHCGMQSFISCLSEPCLCISSSPPPPHPWLQGSIHPCHGALQPPESLAALLTQTATAHCQGSQQRDWPDARLELPTLLWF